MKIQKVIANPFDVEKMRTIFANRGDLKSFKESYSKKNIPEIQNFNTIEFWDNIFSNGGNNVEKSPIFMDKKRKISTFLSKKKGKLLSVGFGTGAIEKEVRRLNNEIELFGIDISNKAVENLSNSTTGFFIKGDILKIPFKSSFFDFILALDVLEHISPTKTFNGYQELKRVLRKNGFLILSVPLNENLEKMVAEERNLNSHVRVYTPEILKAELKTFGFTLVKEIYLYAFYKFYLLKTFLVKNLFFLKIRKPNLLIIIARK